MRHAHEKKHRGRGGRIVDSVVVWLLLLLFLLLVFCYCQFCCCCCWTFFSWCAQAKGGFFRKGKPEFFASCIGRQPF